MNIVDPEKQNRLKTLQDLFADEMDKPEGERRSDLTELARSLHELSKQCMSSGCFDEALTVSTMRESPIKHELMRMLEDGEIDERLDFCERHTNQTARS